MNGNFFSTLLAKDWGDERLLAVSPDGLSVTYGDLDRESGRVAAALLALGLTPGERVSVQIEKSISNLWLYLGVLRAGLVYHPLNTAYSQEEMHYFLDNAEPALLVCDPAKYVAYQPLCESLGIPHVLTLDAVGQGSFSDLCKSCQSYKDVVARLDSDMAVLLYSSGTTGRPKGIMLSHGNLQSNAEVLVEAWQFNSNDVLLHALPVYHVHGLFVGVHCVLMSGASMQWLPSFDVTLVQRFLPSATVMMGVPTYYTRLLAEPTFGQTDCVNMRLFISGSAPLLEETFNAFVARTGHFILERYGMSETGMNCANPLIGERRAATVGFALPGVQVRICDEQHNVKVTGEVGELEIKGPNVFMGYWRMPEKTAQDFSEDGWFVTGDQAVIDDDGYVSIVGRSKDMVITGGLNVYPKEVEGILNEMSEVLESAVFGVAHPDFGEAVVAALVPAPDACIDLALIKSRLDERLAKFKIPKMMRTVSSLPRNAMGKVQKNKLREDWGAVF